MELLQPTNFASAVASSKEQFKKISEIISKYCGQAEADRFLDACNRYDFLTANAILDDTVKELTGYDSVSIAFSAFVDKFPQLSPELDDKVSEALSESDKLKAIESYRSKILNLMGCSDNE
jgi:DNA-directed RNA polymerase subunit F